MDLDVGDKFNIRGGIFEITSISSVNTSINANYNNTYMMPAYLAKITIDLIESVDNNNIKDRDLINIHVTPDVFKQIQWWEGVYS